MKKLLYLALTVIANVFFTFAQTPDFSMIGYAAQEGTGNFYNAGGTTGGAGGETVIPTNFAELKAYVEDPTTPYIILITKEFTSEQPCWVISSTGELVTEGTSGASLATYGEVLKIGSNKSLIGVGESAFFNRIGIVAQCQSNIIIRNIRFTFNGVPTTRDSEMKVIALRNGVETLVGDPDCIGIQADLNSAKTDFGHHYWIDHCEFYNGDAAKKDRYDGLLDMKNNIQYVTISWCKFHNHDKACLSGKGNSDDYPRTVTMHHNYFYNIQGSRLPLQRGGYYHYFNNFIDNCQDGYDLRAKAQSYIEGCYFKDTKAPVMPSGEGEGATLVDLIFENCKRIPTEYAVDGGKYDELYTIPSSTYRPDYEYASYLHKASDVPAIVPLYSGVGIITEGEPVVTITSPIAEQVFDYPSDVTVTATAIDADGTIVSVEILVDGVSKVILSEAPYTTVLTDLQEGAHTIMVRATDNESKIGVNSVNFKLGYAEMTVVTENTFAVGAVNATLFATFQANDDEVISQGFYYGTDSELNTYDEVIATSNSVVVSSLTPLTTYYYQAFISKEDKTIVGEIKTFTTTDVPPVDEVVLISSDSELPTGYSLSFDQIHYAYSTVQNDTYILLESGTHTITLPINAKVTDITCSICCDNNTDGKGTITIAGKTHTMVGRKSTIVPFIVDGLDLTGSITFTTTYKAGFKLEFTVEDNTTDINVVETDKELIRTDYYTIDGCAVTSPGSGFYLVRNVYADGTVETEKVYVK